jgi:hypothetical protein
MSYVTRWEDCFDEMKDMLKELDSCINELLSDDTEGYTDRSFDKIMLIEEIKIKLIRIRRELKREFW